MLGIFKGAVKKRPPQMWRGKPFDGWFEFKFKSGELKEEGEFRNGGRTGPWTTFYKSGEKQSEGEYEKDKKVGEWKQFDESGKSSGAEKHAAAGGSAAAAGGPVWLPVDEAETRDNKPWQGLFEEMHSNGKVKHRGEYAEGKRHGKWRAFSEAEKKWWMGTYADGKKTGRWIVWHPNGIIAQEAQYENDALQGQPQNFDLKGKPK